MPLPSYRVRVLGTTPSCPKCGAEVDLLALFCSRCGAHLRTARELRDVIEPSTREIGSSLEDSVADYFRRIGFDVEPRVKMRDRFDVFHEIDVLASKDEPFGRIRVAIECKHVDARIDIKEVRNFHDKLLALGITKGILVSTGGFTTDAQSHARALGIELWDRGMVKEKTTSTEVPQGDVIHEALPFSSNAVNELKPRHLRNFNLFSESIRFEYKPHYLVDFQCFSQQRVKENSIVLEAKGTVVVDAITGGVVDRKISVTPTPERPIIPGPYAECIGMPTETITSANLPAEILASVSAPRIDSTRARDITRMWLVNTITIRLRFRTSRSSGTRIVKPRIKDIEILNIQAVKIPLLTGTYRFKNHAYTRTMVATTCRTITDQTLSCVQCNAQSGSICENCGVMICASHGKNCAVCGKNLCGTCAISRGVISKKYYCPQHESAQ